jgi:hypothetical protein
MRSTDRPFPRSLRVAVACLVTAAATSSPRADESAAASREALVRKWDLNDDGSIDEGEAEVARSKMRRERADLQLNSGLDPLTGKPKIIATDATDHAAGPEGGQTEQEPRRPKSAAGDQRLPGTGVPDGRPPIPGTRPPSGRDAQPTPGAAAAQATGPQPAAAANPPAAGPGIVTGGARAGAVARPGYGARVPRPDLNAGRLPAGLPGRRPAPAGGGLLPNLRRPPAAPSSPPSPSRRTVDDFDVY